MPYDSTPYTAPDIRLQNVDVGYGKEALLHEVDLHIPPATITVILGGSGCGKSTLLRHLLGLHPPMRGDIFVGKHSLYSMTEEELRRYRQSTGVLFQNGALLGSLTLRENVALPLLEHLEPDEQTLDTVVRHKLSLVGLEAFADYYPAQLSGGMRKRAGLARALALDPGLLLCDEPSAGLDPITSEEVDRLLLDLHTSRGMTMLVVTHDLASLFRIAQHVIVLHANKILFTGTLDALKQENAPYIRRFLGPQSSFSRRSTARTNVDVE